VVLSNNTSRETGRITNAIADIAFGRKPEMPKQRVEIKVDPKIYDAYVGRYQLAPNFILTVTKEDGRLMTQATGQQKIEIFPESETDFFTKLIDAQIRFQKGPDGKADQLTLFQRGATITAKRLPD
jgi:serine-type D-Ala-D-Ala carboxypeptidase/endopeptidase